MNGVPREDLASLLRDLHSGGSFSTRRSAPVDDLVIEVDGVGELRLPVTAAQAKALRLIARPAKYGHGEQTVLDRRVRDTWEVPLRRVRIDQRRWNRTLRGVLDSIRNDLGLPARSSLRAQLHSMLVYEPGQFFAPHQDSEKNDEMLGTLVVMLPSRSIGGDLVVDHCNESIRYTGSATSLTFVAFYADTRHEVLPVETGYRVVLTYNLLLTGDTTASPPAGSLAEQAAEHLHRHFAQTPAPRWHGDRQAIESPDRLVVLLDHQYTERGLRWSHLKGHDATRADTMRRAADLAGCDSALAQAEVHETRGCYDDAPPPWRRRVWSDWDDEPEPEAAPARGGEVRDLLDIAVTIIPVAGEHLRFVPSVDDAELAEVTPTIKLSPYDSEYTGYMGDWGNTMDRWYRRAAIVIWPRSRAFALRAKGDPAGALDELLAPAVADEQSRSDRADRVVTLLRFWPDAVRLDDQHRLLPSTLRLAWELADVQLATQLLEPFTVEAIAPDDATVVAALAEQHGLDWFRRTLSSWLDHRSASSARSSATRTTWVVSLPALCTNLRDDPHSPLGIEVARTLAASLGDRLTDSIGQAVHLVTPSRRQAELAALAGPTLDILLSAGIVGDTALRDRIIAAVREPALPLVPMLLDVVQAAAPLPAVERETIGIEAIAQHCRDALYESLAQPPRASDDWTIRELGPGTCCSDCATLAAFLADPSCQQITWPLAKPAGNTSTTGSTKPSSPLPTAPPGRAAPTSS